MEGMLTRRERQMEKMELAASKGLTSVTLQLHSSEAKRWRKRGLEIISNPQKSFGLYTLTFDHPNLLNIAKCNKFIIGAVSVPEEISYGEYLYLLSRRAIFNQSFMD